MPQDFIVKQSEIGQEFFFIIDGLVEVALEFKEFNYLNFDSAQEFLEKEKIEALEEIMQMEDSETKTAQLKKHSARKSIMPESSPFRQLKLKN